MFCITEMRSKTSLDSSQQTTLLVVTMRHVLSLHNDATSFSRSCERSRNLVFTLTNELRLSFLEKKLKIMVDQVMNFLSESILISWLISEKRDFTRSNGRTPFWKSKQPR